MLAKLQQQAAERNTNTMSPDTPEEIELQRRLQERLERLPHVVQDAIKSSEIEKHLQELANVHKLHLDQWELLENEVKLTLLGFQPTENLAQNIKKEVQVDDETAETLAKDISRLVFEPIRQELERQLEHPAAVAEKTTGVEDMRTQMLTDAAHDVSAVAAQSAPVALAPAPVSAPASTPAPTTVPGTPPSQPVIAQVERTPVSSSYAPAAPSHERKTIEGDPYREQLD
jgi:hypothetical protein